MAIPTSLPDIDISRIADHMRNYRPLDMPPSKPFKAVEDHIPVSNPASAPIEIPFVATSEFVSSGCIYRSSRGHKFKMYPQQIGLDLQRLDCGDFSQFPPFFILGILQQWLFFGMLEEVTGYPIKWDDIVGHNKEGHMVVDPQAYQANIMLWYSRLGYKYSSFMVFAGPGYNDDDPYQLSLETSLACLTKVRSFVTRFRLEIYSLCPPIGGIIHLSILMLGERLQAARDRIPDVVERSRDNLMLFQSTDSWGPAPILENRLLELGWCVGEVHRLSVGMNVCNQYFATFLRLSKSEDHENCTVEECIANQITGPFLEKHATDCVYTKECQCPVIKSDIEMAVEILKRGGVPAIEMTVNSETGDPHICVLGVDSTMKYTAISHVWSDGLGNSEQNGIYRCQLLHLQHCLDTLRKAAGGFKIGHSAQNLFRRKKSPSSHIFWLDTLCIPVAEEHKGYRKVAINLMAETYKNALNVIVLDSEMQQASMRQSREELIMRLYCSGWMRRLWTLQEGVLAAKGLYIQLSDGVLNVFDSIWRNSYKKAYSTTTGQTRGRLSMFKYFLENNFEYESLVYLNRFIRLSDMSGVSLHQRFAYAWDEVRWRNTSRKIDDTVCFAGILGLKPAALLQALDDTAEARMKKLFMLIDEYPTTILFTAKPHMSEDGWKWAPALFPKAEKSMALELPRSYYYRERMVSSGRRCDEGLRVTLSGFLLLPWTRHLPACFNVAYSDFCWRVTSDAGESEIENKTQHRSGSGCESPAFGIVLSDGIPADQWIRAPKLAQAKAPRWAILVEILPSDGAALRASYVTRVQIELIVDENTPDSGPELSETKEALERKFGPNDRLNETSDHIPVLICSKSQEWCIG